jgi:hypothetical protein
MRGSIRLIACQRLCECRRDKRRARNIADLIQVTVPSCPPHSRVLRLVKVPVGKRLVYGTAQSSVRGRPRRIRDGTGRLTGLKVPRRLVDKEPAVITRLDRLHLHGVRPGDVRPRLLCGNLGGELGVDQPPYSEQLWTVQVDARIEEDEVRRLRQRGPSDGWRGGRRADESGLSRLALGLWIDESAQAVIIEMPAV